MNRLSTVNSISATERAQLIHRGIFIKTLDTDTNFLRLRGSYNPAALMVPKSGYLPIPANEKVLSALLAKPFILSAHSLAAFMGFNPRYVNAAISKTGAVSIPKTLLQQSPIFQGSLSNDDYYTYDHIQEISDFIYSEVTDGKLNRHLQDDTPEQAKRFERLRKAYSVSHPDGDEGLRRSVKLFEEECQRITELCRTVYGIPLLGSLKPKTDSANAAPPLTYETLDYSLLDFRKLYGHESFQLMQAIQNASDTKHLVSFMLSAGTIDDLRTHAKAAKAADNPVVLSATEKKAEKAAYVAHMNKARDFCKATWDKSRFGLDFEDAVDADKFTEAMCVAEYDAHLASGNPDPVIAPKKSEMTEAETYADREKWRKDNPSPELAAKLNKRKRLSHL